MEAPALQLYSFCSKKAGHHTLFTFGSTALPSEVLEFRLYLVKIASFKSAGTNRISNSCICHCRVPAAATAALTQQLLALHVYKHLASEADVKTL